MAQSDGRPPRRKYMSFRMRLWIRQKYQCPICNKRIPRKLLYSDLLNLDHIVAKSRGGTRMPENLALVHMACNQAKGSDCSCDWYDPFDNGCSVTVYCTPDIHNWAWPVYEKDDNNEDA